MAKSGLGKPAFQVPTTFEFASLLEKLEGVLSDQVEVQFTKCRFAGGHGSKLELRGYAFPGWEAWERGQRGWSCWLLSTAMEQIFFDILTQATKRSIKLLCLAVHRQLPTWET